LTPGTVPAIFRVLDVTDKLADHLAYPPRVLRVERAAAYVSMSKTAFLRLVESGDMPPGIRIAGMVMWDRLELDAAIEDWKEKGSRSERGNTIERILQERERKS
jgi:predicted DNA-binding transcriptional regulator AlpA